jgi:hypothetical protein
LADLNCEIDQRDDDPEATNEVTDISECLKHRISAAQLAYRLQALDREAAALAAY